MATFTQDQRQLAVTTPLGKDQLLLEEFSATEGLSRLFRLHLEMLAPPPQTVDFSALMGQGVTVKLELDDGSFRFFHGIVSQLSEGEQEQAAETSAVFTRYRAEVVPKLWLLTKRTTSRIFQQLSVPDILKQVLTGLDVAYELQGTYEPRNYCSQYRETDFAFASRLMEEEGIYYFFKHGDGAHKLVVADTPQSCVDVTCRSTVFFRRREEKTPFGSPEYNHRVTSWERRQEIRSANFTLWDHTFEMPPKNLEAKQPITTSLVMGTVTHKLNVGNQGLEVYDYPGDYAHRFDGVPPGGGDQAGKLQKIFQDNARTVKLRMEAEAAGGVLSAGESNCRQFVPGSKFTLQDHFNADGAYVLTQVEHRASQAGIFTSSVTAQLQYGNRFECLPAAGVYRPARETPRPTVEGTQTALVVGPAGQEIFTDKYGRVKVQFFWDRAGKKDAGSSCWVRVATSWAGNQWGMIHIPRIGQEVIVAFLEGNPDRPIVVGSVYNAEQMPPYKLPDHMTKSGLKTRSTTKGGEANFNELRFEDLKGKEEIYFHAEKDFNRLVENNDTLTVGSDKAEDGSQTIKIYKNRTETVETGDEKITILKGNRTVTVTTGNDLLLVSKGNRGVVVSKGNEALSVVKGNREVVLDNGNDLHQLKVGNRDVVLDKGNDAHLLKAGNREVTLNQGNDAHLLKAGNREVILNQGNDSHQLKGGNRSVKIDRGNDTLVIAMGNQSVKLNRGATVTQAGKSITLKVGSSSIKIEPSAITIKALKVVVNADISAKVTALNTKVTGTAGLVLKGGTVKIN